MKLSLILYVLPWLLRFKAWSHKEFRDRLKEKNLTVQFKVADDSIGRSISIKDGRIISAGSIHPSPDVVISFKSERKNLIVRPSRMELFPLKKG